MDLLQKQFAFTDLSTTLILLLLKKGYQVKYGETLRSPATAKLNAQQGKGIKNSLHIIGLAIDLLLFKDGKYLTNSEDYQEAGEMWEEIGHRKGIPTCWGGRFKRPDGNHFSIEHGGVK